MVNTVNPDTKPAFQTKICDGGIELDSLDVGDVLGKSTFPNRSEASTDKSTNPDSDRIAGDTHIGLIGASEDTRVSHEDSRTPEEVAQRKERVRKDIDKWQSAKVLDIHTLAPDRDSLNTKALAPKDQSRAYKALARDYVIAENRLIELEERVQNAESGFLGSIRGAIARFWTRTERNDLRNELTEIRAEQTKIIDQVHRRARELKFDSFINDKKTPNLLRRAGVPESKQNKLPEFSQLTVAITDECARRIDSGKQAQHKIDAQTAVLSRTLEDGSVERIMMRHHSDGRVSLFKNTAETEGEWKRIGTIWTDDAYKVAKGFLDGKDLPRIKRPPLNSKWMLERVKSNQSWAPEEA